MKNKIATIGIIIATVILAGVAIFTAIRLYQLRQESISPIKPTSKPAAAATPKACTSLAFILGVTPTPTPTGGATATPTPTSSPSATPTGMVSPSATPTATPTSPPGATATPTSPPVTQATTTPVEQAALPNAGISYPSLFGIGLGTLLLIGALILAL